jgi:hypothetical protein
VERAERDLGTRVILTEFYLKKKKGEYNFHFHRVKSMCQNLFNLMVKICLKFLFFFIESYPFNLMVNFFLEFPSKKNCLKFLFFFKNLKTNLLLMDYIAY